LYLGLPVQIGTPIPGSRLELALGSAANPSLTFLGDTNTGIFSPAADTIAFAEGGTEVARFDSSGNLGIGTSSPAARLDVMPGSASATAAKIYAKSTLTSTLIALGREDNAVQGAIWYDGSDGGIGLKTITSHPLKFGTVDTERMRIDTSGNLLVGTTSSTNAGRITAASDSGGASYPIYANNTNTGSTSQIVIDIARNGTRTGSISNTNSSTAYSTSSDYRLKENVQPMTGALSKVVALKPCTYKWKADDTKSQGFIAHELQEVVPECVTGEKDAVDADGNPVYQGIDTSFLVATLTAAIQELKADLDATKAEVALLKGAA
jgi:hypothetical protein